MDKPIIANVDEVRQLLSDMFHAAGLARGDAGRVADILLDADVSGRASHGVQLADLYLGRLCNGTMTKASKPNVVSDDSGCVVLDANGMEGHLAAEFAMRRAVEGAAEHGISVVAMRNAFHAGVLGHYARMAADAGCVGIAMCNTKSIMAAPGGAERLLGTNPIAIGFPVRDEEPFVFDMATTAGAMGKIRQLQAAGTQIPENWALDSKGRPTRDAAEAIAGFLLPAAGAKGFGLALVVDMLSGGLASGGWGPHVGEMRSDEPYNGSSLFLALDISRFRDLDGFLEQIRDGVERVRGSKTPDGAGRLKTPGQRRAEAIAASDGTISLSPVTAKQLSYRARKLGLVVPSFLTPKT